MSATPFRMVEVDWLDSQGDSSWQSVSSALADAEDDTLLHHSVGYLLAENDRYVLLAQSVNDGDDEDRRRTMVADTLQIPRAVVLEVRDLTGRKAAK